jgi:hypothetical protein
MHKPSLGPYFTETPSKPTGNPKIIPLHVSIEWATPDHSQSTPLFQHSPTGVSRPALHEIVFRAEELPCSVRCQEFQAVDAPAGAYVPLEALLVTIYQNGLVSRPIFDVLAELSALVPMRSSVSNPPRDPEGLLLPGIEKRGFRVANVVAGEDQVFVDIGWYPERNSTPFHTCVCAFAHTPGKLSEGEWIPSPMIGVHQLLVTELRRIATSAPGKAITAKGRQYLQEFGEPTTAQIRAKRIRHEESADSGAG